jgi:exopolyphosphatase/guanosine-5'-triphosphate,3'-diphosphate pyrophosphatase
MSDRRPAAKCNPPAAVVDIGSNSIRLVIYETSDRAPLPIFNEKILCGLGRGLDETGRLSEDGIEQALAALPRFMRIAREMEVGSVDLLATAAARDAENGPEFTRRAGQLCGAEIRVLSGEEEARLSGLGVLSGTPEAEGLMGDLGGGSVELVELGGGTTGRQATLPMGPLRLDPKLVAKPTKAREEIDRRLAGVAWLPSLAGRPLYLVGGAWRNLARLHMDHIDYPLHIIHHYRIGAADALEFVEIVSRQSAAALSGAPGVSKRRVEVLPYAAMLLHRIMLACDPSEIVFSANGLREGCLFDRLDPAERARDPLFAATDRYISGMRPSAAVSGDQLCDWMAPLFPDAPEAEMRLARAACLLADIGKREHPDYRAEHALLRVQRLPVVGIDHPGRAFLSLAVASRHAQLPEDRPGMSAVAALLTEEQKNRAQAIGLAIRLAYTLTGGVADVLGRTRLTRRDGTVVLSLPEDLGFLAGEAVERRFAALSKALGLESEIER